MNGLGNQQERLALAGYLAGIIDGEGCIMLNRITTPDRVRFRPVVAVHMVSPETIDHLAAVSEKLGLETYHCHLKASSRWATYGKKRTLALLDVVQPHLCTKRRQAELIREYFEVRSTRPYHSPVSDQELEIVKAVSGLNTKGKNPQRLYASLELP